jgi:hypothetical protein
MARQMRHAHPRKKKEAAVVDDVWQVAQPLLSRPADPLITVT